MFNTRQSHSIANLLSTLFICFVFTCLGCGTDAKPSYFTNILRDESDMDALAKCLTKEPEIGTEDITVTVNKKCLIDLSNTDHGNTNPTFAEILRNPEAYLDRLLEFEAVIKDVSDRKDSLKLYTNDPDIEFEIRSDGTDIYTATDKGEPVPIESHKKYKLKCRIYQVEVNVDWGAKLRIRAKLAVSSDKKLLHPPILVE